LSRLRIFKWIPTRLVAWPLRPQTRGALLTVLRTYEGLIRCVRKVVRYCARVCGRQGARPEQERPSVSAAEVIHGQFSVRRTTKNVTSAPC
jgi:hypothetical protein